MPGLRDRSLSDFKAIIKTQLNSRETAITMATAALDAKAEDVVILDLRKLSSSFDFFVLATASSDRRIQGITDQIEEAMGKRNGTSNHLHREGTPEGGWFLIDLGAVVGHIFSPELRQFYGLERLWADAPWVSVSPSGSKAPRSKTTRTKKRSRRGLHSHL